MLDKTIKSIEFMSRVFVTCLERPKWSLKFSNGLTKYSKTLRHNHQQNILKSRFMAISAFRWKSCGLSKCFIHQQGSQTSKKLFTLGNPRFATLRINVH